MVLPCLTYPIISLMLSHIHVHYNFSLVAMGGDGSVHRMINGLLNLTQKQEKVDVRPNFLPAKAPIPVGIIPVGRYKAV